MTQMGILESVEDWVLTAIAETQAAYNLAYMFERKESLWDSVMSAFTWDEMDIDRMFMRAQQM